MQQKSVNYSKAYLPIVSDTSTGAFAYKDTFVNNEMRPALSGNIKKVISTDAVGNPSVDNRFLRTDQ